MRLQGDDEAPVPLIAMLAPLFLQHPVDPDEMLDWRADYVMKMMIFGSIHRKVSQKENWDG